MVHAAIQFTDEGIEFINPAYALGYLFGLSLPIRELSRNPSRTYRQMALLLPPEQLLHAGNLEAFEKLLKLLLPRPE